MNHGEADIAAWYSCGEQLGSVSHHHLSSNFFIMRKMLSCAVAPTLRLPSTPTRSGVSPVSSASQLGTALVGSATRIVSSSASASQSALVRKPRNCV